MKKRAGYLYDPIKIERDRLIGGWLKLYFSGSGEEGSLPLYVSGDAIRYIYHDDDVDVVDRWYIYVGVPTPSDPDNEFYREKYNVGFKVAPDENFSYLEEDGMWDESCCYFDKNGDIADMSDVLAEWIKDNVSYPDWVEDYYHNDEDVEMIMNSFNPPKTYEEFIERAVSEFGWEDCPELADDLYEWAREEWFGIPEKTSRKKGYMKKKVVNRYANRAKKRVAHGRAKVAMNNWRGCANVYFQHNGAWSDPDIIYNGYTFNYWDIEDALYEMFLEDNPEMEGKGGTAEFDDAFDAYCQECAESYLDDVICFGYFDDGSKNWHDRYR